MRKKLNHAFVAGFIPKCNIIRVVFEETQPTQKRLSLSDDGVDYMYIIIVYNIYYMYMTTEYCCGIVCITKEGETSEEYGNNKIIIIIINQSVRRQYCPKNDVCACVVGGWGGEGNV